MTMERARRLMDVGFEWTAKNPRHLMWEVRFAELRDFKNSYGHAQVPIGWEQNVQLANWVSTQRQEYKNLIKGKTSRLNDKRVSLLNSLGFAWELQRGGRRRRLAVNKNNPNAIPNPPHPADLEEINKTDLPETEYKFAIDDGTPVKRIAGGRKRTTLKKKATTVDDSTKCILPGVAIMGGHRDAPIPSRPTNNQKGNKNTTNNNSGSSRNGRDPTGSGSMMMNHANLGGGMGHQDNQMNPGNNMHRAMQAGGNPNPWQMLPNGAYQQAGHPFAHFMGGGMGPGGFFPMAAGPFGMNGMHPFANQGNGMAGNGMDPSQYMSAPVSNNEGDGFHCGNGGGNGMNPQEMDFRRMQMQQAAAFGGGGPGMGMSMGGMGGPHGNQPPFPVMSGNMNPEGSKPDDDGSSNEGNVQQNRQQMGGSQGMGGMQMPNQFGGWGPGGGGIPGNFWNENAAAAAAAAQHLQAAAALTAGMDERSLPPHLAQMASMARRMNGGIGGGGPGGEMGGSPMGGMPGGNNGGPVPNMNMNMMGMGMNGMGGNGMGMGMNMNMGNNPMMGMQGRGRRADPPADPPSGNFGGMMQDGSIGHSDLKRKSAPDGSPQHPKKMRMKQDIFEDADED
jgi:Helicase associated domain